MVPCAVHGVVALATQYYARSSFLPAIGFGFTKVDAVHNAAICDPFEVLEIGCRFNLKY